MILSKCRSCFHYWQSIHYNIFIHAVTLLVQRGIALLITLTLFLNCNAPRKITENNYTEFEPPNSIKVYDNLYCDRTEIDMISWKSYCSWMKKIFGDTSRKYISTLPDTNVWIDCYNYPLTHGSEYMHQPAFDYFPVVSITQQQALEYSKWRTDRVFEFLLISLNKVEIYPNQNKDDFFTFEKYFNGTYSKIRPGLKVLYYPDFRLPTLAERKLILHFADSVDKATPESSKLKNKIKRSFRENHIGKSANKDTILPELKIEQSRNFFSQNEKSICNLRSNVSEWSAEKNIAFRGGYIYNQYDTSTVDTFYLDKLNGWTGFRNVCEWKKWLK